MCIYTCIYTYARICVCGHVHVCMCMSMLSDQSLSKIAHTCTHARVRCESWPAHQRPYAIQNAWHSVQAVV